MLHIPGDGWEAFRKVTLRDILDDWDGDEVRSYEEKTSNIEKSFQPATLSTMGIEEAGGRGMERVCVCVCLERISEA